MSTRRQLRAAVTEVDRTIPEVFTRCVVEDWCSPETEPIESWRGEIRPGTCDWVWHWQIVARGRYARAVATYRAEHGITEAWPTPGRPLWRREQ